MSDCWSPPDDSGLGGSVGEPVACLTTTFEFDAAFFESELLPRFLGLRFDHSENERTFVIEREEALGRTRAAVMVDMAKFDPRQTTLQWDQVCIHVPGGVQHAKLTLLVWERVVRLLVTSANLTPQGYRRNRELAAVLDFFDDPTSVPLTPLHQALDFLSTLCAWSRALPAATERVRETVALVRSRVDAWTNAPQDFAPRQRPRVTLIVGRPQTGNETARSPLQQLLDVWGERRVQYLTVITPFVGQQSRLEDAVLSRLESLPILGAAHGWLVVPESPTSEGSERCVVALPQAFAEHWARVFGEGERAHVLPIPRYVETADEANRELHAKAILFEGDSHDLLLVGSSNFTPHGMGVQAFNCEANVAFEDKAGAKQAGLTLDDRLGLPIPWEDGGSVTDIVWEDPGEAPEDAPPSAPSLPRFFAWASYSQATGEIRLALDRSRWEPPRWCVSLTRRSVAGDLPLFSAGEGPASVSLLSTTLADGAIAAQFAALRVSWHDVDDVARESFLPVAVEDRETDLLPPETFRNLTTDTIIECLLSGRDPASWFDRESLTQNAASAGADAAVDSLRAVDTSTYVLYRVRRLGRALGRMAERIAVAAPTPDALRYRLFRDPFGPVHLAESLRSREDPGEKEVASLELAYRLYAIAEIVLLLGHVSRRVQQTAEHNGEWVQSAFREATQRIREAAESLQQTAEAKAPPDLLAYLAAAAAVVDEGPSGAQEATR